MTPEEARECLSQGNSRFVAGQHNIAGWSIQRRRECLEPAQMPFAAVMACADSRAPVEILFDAAIGDLFVVRSAGARPDKFGLASFDFAAEILNVPLIIVLGHTQCRMVKFALDNPALPGRIPEVADKVRGALLRLRNAADVIPPEELFARAVVHNTRDTAEEIHRQCRLVQKKEVAGKLKIVGAVYNIESGEVKWLER